MRSTIKRLGEGILSFLPRRVAPGDFLHLAYHNIVDDDCNVVGDRSLHIRRSDFLAQLDAIRELFDVRSLASLLRSERTEEPAVSISFDDAYVGAIRLGVSGCVERGLPCTVFVAPGLLGVVPAWDRFAAEGTWTDIHRASFLFDKHGRGSHLPTPSENSEQDHIRIATEAELSLAARCPGVELGNHTMTHVNLASIETAVAVQEISEADAWLKARYPSSYVPIVAYPYGYPPKQASEVLRTTQIRHGLLVSGGWSRGMYRAKEHSFPRWNVPAGISLAGFRLRLNGYADRSSAR